MNTLDLTPDQIRNQANASCLTLNQGMNIGSMPGWLRGFNFS